MFNQSLFCEVDLHTLWSISSHLESFIVRFLKFDKFISFEQLNHSNLGLQDG